VDSSGINRLVRQKELGLTIPQSVAVVGCGGVGSWTAYFLALAGVPQLELFDGDTVSVTNLNRVPYTSRDLGEHKSIALEKFIKRQVPGIIVTSDSHFIPSSSIIESKYMVVTTDTWASRRECSEWCEKESIVYVEAAAEGEFGSCTDTPADFATEDEARPGYASVPVWAGPCVIGAILACEQVLHNGRLNGKCLRLGWNEGGCCFYE